MILSAFSRFARPFVLDEKLLSKGDNIYLPPAMARDAITSDQDSAQVAMIRPADATKMGKAFVNGTITTMASSEIAHVIFPCLERLLHGP